MRLIDADELKECFRWSEVCRLSISEINKIIDNAPTVEERPQGELIAREDMDFLDENKAVHNHFQCNQCGLIHDFIDGHTSQYNFCPQCGSKKKGGAK